MQRSIIMLLGLFFFNINTLFAGEVYQKAVRDAYHKVLMSMVENELSTVLTNPDIITAIKRQNNKNRSLNQSDIDELDKTWRKEAKMADKPLIQGVLSTDVSKYLMQLKSDSLGLYTEIFVMDNKGLNVAQSDITSDYWQGDEAKWIKTYKLGANAVHIGDINIDESSQEVQVQLSISISDTSNSVIGAITFGINLLKYNV